VLATLAGKTRRALTKSASPRLRQARPAVLTGKLVGRRGAGIGLHFAVTTGGAAGEADAFVRGLLGRGAAEDTNRAGRARPLGAGSSRSAAIDAGPTGRTKAEEAGGVALGGVQARGGRRAVASVAARLTGARRRLLVVADSRPIVACGGREAKRQISSSVIFSPTSLACTLGEVVFDVKAGVADCVSPRALESRRRRS